MTKEQKERLSKYELAMSRAVKLNFLHLSAGEFNEIMSVYNELFPPLNKSQMNCGTCRLNAVKKLAAEYFKEDEEKPKRGRPKKIEKLFKLFEKNVEDDGTDTEEEA